MRLGILLAPAAAATVLALTGCTAPAAAPDEVPAPTVSEGELLGSWTGFNGGRVTTPVDAEGAGLIVALDCAGVGTVEVALSPGSTSKFSCRAGQVTSELNRIEIPHPEPMTLTVTGSSGVAWGLTVAAIDL
jgi:hypothetical protein